MLELSKGSGEPNREKVGSITRAQIEEIVTAKPEPVAVAAGSASDDDALSYFQRLAEE